jgi:hypothetical protein
LLKPSTAASCQQSPQISPSLGTGPSCSRGSPAASAPAQPLPAQSEDRAELTTRPHSYQEWPGAAPEGSIFHGQRARDGLALDANGKAVVLDPTGRKVLIGSANGRRIQELADMLNDASGRVSDLDKAKAYNELVRAFQDSNPNFTEDEKRAAAGVVNSAAFTVKVEALNERTNAILRAGAARRCRLRRRDGRSARLNRLLRLGAGLGAGNLHRLARERGSAAFVLPAARCAGARRRPQARHRAAGSEDALAVLAFRSHR